MAMVSAGLRQAMDQRTRATYVVRSSFAVQSESARSSSVPAVLRHQGSSDKTKFDPALVSSSAARSSIPRHETLISSSMPTGTALSASSLSKTVTAEELTGSRSTGDAPSRTLVAEDAVDNGRSENGRGDEEASKLAPNVQVSSRKSASSANRSRSANANPKVETAPVRRAKQDQARAGKGSRGGGDVARKNGGGGEKCCVSDEGVHEGKQGSLAVTSEQTLDSSIDGPEQRVQHSDLCLPEKLMELMEDRDRAVQLCLQVFAQACRISRTIHSKSA